MITSLTTERVVDGWLVTVWWHKDNHISFGDDGRRRPCRCRADKTVHHFETLPQAGLFVASMGV